MAQVAVEPAGFNLAKDFAVELLRRMESMRKLRCSCGQTAALADTNTLHDERCPAYYWAMAMRTVTLQLEDFLEKRGS